MNKRWLAAFACAAMMMAGGFDVAAEAPPAPAAKLAAADAHAAAAAGKLVLVDIRTPAEWTQSGLPASGHAISMDQPQAGFLGALAQATGGDKAKPIALICATGNRSARLQAWLAQAGYSAVADVAEGMIGGTRGRGWIKSGLPVRKWIAGAVSP